MRHSNCTTGAAMSKRAIEKRGQLNECGSMFRHASTPPLATRMLSAMKTYSASSTPMKFRAHAFQAGREGIGFVQPLASVPQRIKSRAIETGAQTGPHHG